MTTHGASILVVDDDAILAGSIVRNLSARGYAAEAAGDVDEALRKIDENAPGLVLLDVDLPGGSGWDVARSIRSQSGEKTPVIVISGLRPNQRLVDELGCSGVLEKPYPMDALLRLVIETVGEGTGTKAAQAVVSGSGSEDD